jgi:hypothetical protein
MRLKQINSVAARMVHRKHPLLLTDASHKVSADVFETKH